MARFRPVFHGVCTVVLLIFLYNGSHVLKPPILFRNHRSPPNSASISEVFPHRRLPELNITQIDEDSSSVLSDNPSVACIGIDEHAGYANRCEFLKSHSKCTSGGFFDYIAFFYCTCGGLRVLGLAILFIWLVALFYMLGNTAEIGRAHV